MKSKEISWYRIFEIVAGCCIAIILAMGLQLESAMSAGIIAILSIQDTKRATLRGAAERFAAFALAMLLSVLCFRLLGHHVLSFALYLLPFTLLCYFLKIHTSIPICTVLVTHLWLAGELSVGLLLNELYLMLIGTGIGITLNLFLPSSLSVIKREQFRIEEAIRALLFNFAELLRHPDRPNALQNDYRNLNEVLSSARDEAMTLFDNTLTRDVRYYVRYVEMRISQASVLKRMVDALDTFDRLSIAQAHPIADILSHIATAFHEKNDAIALLDETSALMKRYRAEPLPETRAEFEARATLYRILLDIEQLLSLKRGFYESLTPEEREAYWR